MFLLSFCFSSSSLSFDHFCLFIASFFFLRFPSKIHSIFFVILSFLLFFLLYLHFTFLLLSHALLHTSYPSQTDSSSLLLFLPLNLYFVFLHSFLYLCIPLKSFHYFLLLPHFPFLACCAPLFSGCIWFVFCFCLCNIWLNICVIFLFSFLPFLHSCVLEFTTYLWFLVPWFYYYTLR